MIGVVKTKQVFAPFEESDGERYLITREYAGRPKTMKTLHILKWIRDLAPSKQLLSDYHKGLSPDEYIPRFIREINKEPKSTRMARNVSEENRGWE